MDRTKQSLKITLGNLAMEARGRIAVVCLTAVLVLYVGGVVGGWW